MCRSPRGSADRNCDSGIEVYQLRVAPRAGARIETMQASTPYVPGGRRSPRGSADRNAIAEEITDQDPAVAPRAGARIETSSRHR